jgi:hypothetical protein
LKESNHGENYGVAIQAKETKHDDGRLVFTQRVTAFFLTLGYRCYVLLRTFGVQVLIDLNEEHV